MSEDLVVPSHDMRVRTDTPENAFNDHDTENPPGVMSEAALLVDDECARRSPYLYQYVVELGAQFFFSPIGQSTNGATSSSFVDEVKKCQVEHEQQIYLQHVIEAHGEPCRGGRCLSWPGPHSANSANLDDWLSEEAPAEYKTQNPTGNS